MKTKIRLENDKKIFIVDLNESEYTVISGQKSGTMKKEGHKVLTARKKWTTEQETLHTVSRIVNAKLARGFAATDKSGNPTPEVIENFMAEVKAQLTNTEKVERLQKMLERAKGIAERAQKQAEKATVAAAKKAERVAKIEAMINA